MSEMTLFKTGNSLVSPDLMKELQELNKKLIGGGGNFGKRLSFKGSRFREMVNGEQVRVSKEDTMNVIILDAAPIGRTYYEGTYDSDNPSAPRCWSQDTKYPAPEVDEDDRMSTSCAECPMNVKGSGQGESRACRYSQRLAVALENDYENVYQMQLAATSVFGDTVGKHMPMQAYAKFLNAHNAPAIAVVTEMSFDEDSDVPKLYFRAVRPLEEDELKEVLELRQHEDVKKAITFTVSKTDGVEKKAEKAAPAPAKKSKRQLAMEAEEAAEKGQDKEEEAPPKRTRRTRAQMAEDSEAEEPPKRTRRRAAEDDEDVEEPMKVASKKDESAPKTDLTGLLDDWDDD